MAWTKTTTAATLWNREHALACIFDSTEGPLSPHLRAFDISVFDEDSEVKTAWVVSQGVTSTWTKTVAMTSTYWSKVPSVSTTWTKSATAIV